MISYLAKKSLIYKELSVEQRYQFFDFTQKKFLHNIDSLYYVVKCKNDWKYDDRVKLFLSCLEKYRQKAIRSLDPIILFSQETDIQVEVDGDLLVHGIGSKPYTYDFGKADKYTCFIMSSAMNDKTPTIWVQLRSQNLWLNGEYKALEESLNDLEKILSYFGIEIEEVKENRIDYAYHTNYIQDPTNFFKSENINRMQKSRFSRWSLEGSFNNEFDTDVDYFTLGRKKSNNLFFRTYDKTKEVIEQGYKQFFIKLWYLEKMINFFDLYCIEKAFLQPSNTKYKYLDIARLEFYLEFGQDENFKSDIRSLIDSDDRDYEKIQQLANKLVPPVTKVLNVELETKRKFYYSMDNSVDTLLKLKSKCPDYAKRLYVKLDNKQVFHNYLVCNNEEQQGVIRFLDFKALNKYGKPWTKKDKYPTADWWKRLQGTKVNKKFKSENVTLVREYQKNLSADLLKKKITNSISTYSLYVHGDDVQNDTYNDVLDYLATLTENDMQKAIDYKQKKLTLLKNRLGDVSGLSDKLNSLKLYDLETGQLY